MKTDLIFTHVPITDDKLRDRTVVVVDVLRASTTVCVALKNGAREVIPVESVPAAMELTGNLSRDNVLLCGEREGTVIEGFDLGNSPREYTAEVVNGKSLIFCTTNGSVALTKTKAAGDSIVCGFVNISACVEFISHQNSDLLIICAGNNNQFSLEDAVCGGLLVQILQNEMGRKIKMNDGTEAALIIYKKYKNKYLDLLKKCTHGKYLIKLGLGNDLPICADVDSINLVPVYSKGRLTLAGSETRNGNGQIL